MERETPILYPKRYPGYKRGKIQKESLKDENFYRNDQLCEFDVWADPSMIKMLPRETASATFQSIVKLNTTPRQLLSMTTNQKVFIKAFPVAFSETIGGEENNSLVREIAIHRYLSYLSKYQVTPCIQRYFADFICPLSPSGIGSKFSNKVRSEEFWKDRTGRFAHPLEMRKHNRDPRIHYTLSEYIEGPSLYDWLREGNISLEDFKSILFQILYTTWQFHLAGLRHNDLHAKNIFISPSTSKKPLTFILGNRMTTVSGNYIAKIIDFDRAGFFVKGMVENIFPSYYCEDFGTCLDGMNRSFDAVKIMTDVYTHHRGLSQECKNYLERLVNKLSSDPDNMIRRDISIYKTRWPGLLCRTLPGRGPCVNWEPPASLFKFFPEIMVADDLETGVTKLDKDSVDNLAVRYSQGSKIFIGLDADQKLLDFLDYKKSELQKQIVKNPEPIKQEEKSQENSFWNWANPFK